MLTLLLTVALAAQPAPADPAQPAPSDPAPPAAAPTDPAPPAPAPPAPAPPAPAPPTPAPPTPAPPATANPAAPLTEQAFTALVAELATAYGSAEISTATPGFDATDRVRAVLAGADLVSIGVTRVSELAEPDKVAARLVKRSACVLYVTPAAGGFRVARFGSCADRPPAPAADPPSLADREPRGAEGPQRPASGAAGGPPSIARSVSASDRDLRPLTRSDWDLELARLRAPDPVVATLMSGLVGFGSGHFYAESPGSGAVHLVLQLASGALVAAGTIAMGSLDNVVFERGQAAFAVGTTTAAILRLVETATVPRKASRAAARQLEVERQRLGY